MTVKWRRWGKYSMVIIRKRWREKNERGGMESLFHSPYSTIRYDAAVVPFYCFKGRENLFSIKCHITHTNVYFLDEENTQKVFLLLHAFSLINPTWYVYSTARQSAFQSISTFLLVSTLPVGFFLPKILFLFIFSLRLAWSDHYKQTKPDSETAR